MKLFTGWAMSAGLVFVAAAANAQVLTPSRVMAVSDVGGPYAAMPPEAPPPGYGPSYGSRLLPPIDWSYRRAPRPPLPIPHVASRSGAPLQSAVARQVRSSAGTAIGCDSETGRAAGIAAITHGRRRKTFSADHPDAGNARRAGILGRKPIIQIGRRMSALLCVTDLLRTSRHV